MMKKVTEQKYQLTQREIVQALASFIEHGKDNAKDLLPFSGYKFRWIGMMQSLNEHNIDPEEIVGEIIFTDEEFSDFFAGFA